MSRAPRIRTSAGVRVAALAVLATAALAAAPAAAPARLARAQELIDAGRPEEAIELVETVLREEPRSAEAFLLRSTARFVLGELEAGRADLDRALELDPALRQGWLNRAALDMAENDLDAAYEALLRARALDPGAADNDVNLGAVVLLRGDLRLATEHFQRYLERSGGSADAHYLVAKNYALAGYAALAIQSLKRAVLFDERIRLRVRTDATFADLVEHAEFQELLATDSHRVPEGSYLATRAFDVPYEGADGRLLEAVLDALQLSGDAFDRRVEVTPDWALIWSDVRIKVSRGPAGKGLVEVSAPPDRFTPGEWQARVERLFQQIAAHLI